MGDKSRSTSSHDGRDGRNEDRMEENTHTTAKNSFASVMEGGNGSNVGLGKTGEQDRRVIEKTSVARSKEKHSEKTLSESDYPTRLR